MTLKNLYLSVFALGLFTITSAEAQLPSGSFGVGADLSQTFSTANVLYAVSPALQLQAGIGYNYRNWDQDVHSNAGTSVYTSTDNSSQLVGTLGAKVFLKGTGVLPYIGGTASYTLLPRSENLQTNAQGQSKNIRQGYGFGGNLFFGGQYFVMPQLALHGQFGIGYSWNKQTEESGFTNNTTDNAQTSRTNTSQGFNFGNTSLGISLFF